MTERQRASRGSSRVEQIKADLAEIKGDIKHGLALQDERMGRIQADVRDLKDRQHDHANRLTILEATNLRREGALGSVKTAWIVLAAFIGMIGSWLKQKLGF